MSSLLSKITLSLRWNALSIVSKFVTEYIVRLGLTAILAPEDFGIFAIALSLIMILQVLVNGGFQASLIQRRRDFDTTAITQVSFLIMACYALVVASLSALISYFSFSMIFDDVGVVNAFYLLLLTLFLVPNTTIYTAQLSRHLRFNKITKAEIANHFVYALLVIYLSINNLGYYGLVVAHIVGQVTRLIFLNRYSKQKISIRFAVTKLYERKKIKGWSLFISRTSYFFLANFVAMLRSRSDVLLIGALIGSTATGLYSLAFALTEAIQAQVASIINKTMFPIYSSVQDSKSTYEELYLKVSMYTSLLLVPMYILLYFYSDIIVENYFSQEWQGISNFIKLFCISSVIYAFGGYPSELINALGRADLAFRISLANYLLIALPTLVLLIFWYGAIGAPISIIIHYTTLRLSQFFILNRVFHIGLIRMLQAMAPGAALGTLTVCLIFFLRSL